MLTVNLCVLVAGLTNRYLPSWIFLGTFVFGTVPCSVLAAMVGGSLWLCLTLCFILQLPLMWGLGLPLARLLGPFCSFFGFDDCKYERVDLFLRFLQERPDWASVDVVCIQECYTALYSPGGGYPQRLVAGAQALGFRHVVLPSRRPAWPATMAQNSGLLILSKRAIKRHACKIFGFSLEAANVNRGALYAALEDGTHIFTCHCAPSASVGGRGLIVQLLAPFVEYTRRRQIDELVSFIEEQAPWTEPTIVAGDFNLDISFKRFSAEAVASQYACQLASAFKDRCNLVEATMSIRGLEANVGRHRLPSAFSRPSFGYTGEDIGYGPAECWLTSYGTGVACLKCDDAVFFRGFTGVHVAEDSLLIPSGDRPHPCVTHLSDHWAIRVTLDRFPHTGARMEDGVGGESSPLRTVDQTHRLRNVGNLPSSS